MEKSGNEQEEIGVITVPITDVKKNSIIELPSNAGWFQHSWIG